MRYVGKSSRRYAFYTERERKEREKKKKKKRKEKKNGWGGEKEEEDADKTRWMRTGKKTTTEMAHDGTRIKDCDRRRDDEDRANKNITKSRGVSNTIYDMLRRRTESNVHELERCSSPRFNGGDQRFEATEIDSVNLSYSISKVQTHHIAKKSNSLFVPTDKWGSGTAQRRVQRVRRGNEGSASPLRSGQRGGHSGRRDP